MSLISSFRKLRFMFVIWFIAYLYSASGYQGNNETVSELLKRLKVESDKKMDLHDFCDGANIKNYNAFSKVHNIVVSFELSDVKYKKCFKYFKIVLERKSKTVKTTMIPYLHDNQNPISYKFKNVSCGAYNVSVNACYTDRVCTPGMRYPYLINISSYDCLNISPKVELIPRPDIELEIIIIIAIISAVVVFVVSALTYYYCQSGEKKMKIAHKTRSSNHEYSEITDGGDDRIKTIQVYILHPYDRDNTIKRKVECVKDFLSQFPYYHTKVIESELAVILYNVNDWLRNALEERDSDGSFKKIILIDSEEENEADDYEMENLIFSEFINLLSNNNSRCLTDYNNLFVVRFNGTFPFSERIRRIVREHRYYLPDHFIDLCLNLCSGSELDIVEVERNVSELCLQYSIRHSDVAQDA